MPTKPATPTMLHQKLLAIRKTVPYLQKDNEGFKFKYVSSSQTLGALRTAMDEQGVLLIPRIIKYETRDHTTKSGGHEYFTIIEIEFTWVNVDDPAEMIVCPWLGHGLDDGEKGAGKAMTYAEKYFMLKFFNIATDKDDPDSFQRKHDLDPAPSTASTSREASHAPAPTQEQPEGNSGEGLRVTAGDPCPECGNALKASQYRDGETYCGKCKASFTADGTKKDPKQEQRKRIFAISKKLNLTKEQVKELLSTQYHVNSSEAMTVEQLREFADKLAESDERSIKAELDCPF